MRKLLGLAVVLCLTTLPGQAADDKDSVEGSWDLVSSEFGSTKIDTPKDKALSLTFKGGKFTKKETGKKDEDGTYKTDETKKLKEIDLTAPKADKPTEMETMNARRIEPMVTTDRVGWVVDPKMENSSNRFGFALGG